MDRLQIEFSRHHIVCGMVSPNQVFPKLCVADTGTSLQVCCRFLEHAQCLYTFSAKIG